MVVGGAIVLAACSLTTDLDGLSSHYGDDDDATSTATAAGGMGGAGGNQMGGPVTVSTSGPGGAAINPCKLCLQHFDSGPDPAPIEDLCGYVAPPAVCAATSSCGLAEALLLCVCGGEGQAGVCATECPARCGQAGDDLNTCDDCTVLSCPDEFTACAQDTGEL